MDCVRSASAQGPSAGAITVSDPAGGQPCASIVLREWASEFYRFTATELQRYFGALSGSQIEIATDIEISSRPTREAMILFGEPAATKPFRIRLLDQVWWTSIWCL
jgi:hypothetical protein